MVDPGRRARERGGNAAMPRVAIVVDRPAEPGKAYRVEAPDRVLRMFGVLTAARDELDLTAVPPECRARVQRLLETVRAELERSVSPDLADELRNFIRPGEPAPGAAELRVEYATLLGWASGLVVAMLDQLSGVQDRPKLLSWPFPAQAGRGHAGGPSPAVGTIGAADRPGVTNVPSPQAERPWAAPATGRQREPR